MAPGPLETDLARRLQLLADVESRGGATVYRFTAGSVRRALDVGWSAVEVHEFLGAVSRTPGAAAADLPGRRHRPHVRHHPGRPGGGVPARRRRDRAVGAALHHPKAATLGLRRLAPTVLVSATADRRAAAAAARARRRAGRRGRRRHRAGDPPRPAARPGAARASVRRRARCGRRRGSPRWSRRSAPATGWPRRVPHPRRRSPRAARWWRCATRSRPASTVLIGYVDNHGTATDRIVDPLSVEGGQLHGPRPPRRRRPHLRRAPDHRPSSRWTRPREVDGCTVRDSASVGLAGA